MESGFDIFISYRRESGRDMARLIKKQLEIEGYKVFFDYSEIKDNDFGETIIPAIRHCKVFILVLTANSLDRCNNTTDWVRQEIETAIESNCKIISVTPTDPQVRFIDWPADLPDALSIIKTLQISEIQFESLFEASIKKLIDDRISTVLPNKISHNVDDSQSAFTDYIKNIYDALIRFREAAWANDPRATESTLVIVSKSVKQLYYFSERNRGNDIVYSKTKSIVDQYNLFIDIFRNLVEAEKERPALKMRVMASDELTKFINLCNDLANPINQR